MFALTGVLRDYAWGSRSAIPEFLGEQPSPTPVAELWFGAHTSGPSPIPELGTNLAELIGRDPRAALGDECVERFGEELPFLLKVLAPAAPLSLQVHPSREQARDGYARALAGGSDAPADYVDANHKPELLYPLTEFEALSGFRSAEEIVAAFTGIEHPLAHRVREMISTGGAGRIDCAFAHVLNHATPEAVDEIARQCDERLAANESPFPHSDEIMGRLARAHPGDRGVVASLFLVPRRLQPAEAMFVPAGVVHVYLDGLGVELMANSDNVLRAGLTHKRVDVPELLNVLNPHANVVFPEAREEGRGIHRFPLPVDDFELTVVDAEHGETTLHAPGPRILLSLSVATRVAVKGAAKDQDRERTLARGEAIFLDDCAGAAVVAGGIALQAGVPARIAVTDADRLIRQSSA